MTTSSLRISFPPDYSPIPLDRDSADQKLHVDPTSMEAVAALGELLVSTGVVTAGLLTLPNADPSISAVLTIAVCDLPTGPPRAVKNRVADANDLANMLRGRHQDATVGVRELANGPVALIARYGQYQLPGEMTVSRRIAEIPSRRLQVLVPVSPSQIILVNLDTVHTEHWQRFIGITLGVTETIRIDGIRS